MRYLFRIKDFTTASKSMTLYNKMRFVFNVHRHNYHSRVEFLKSACPSCDDVRCPEGNECQMVDGLPTCVVRVPGGCEENKCGENG